MLMRRRTLCGFGKPPLDQLPDGLGARDPVALGPAVELGDEFNGNADPDQRIAAGRRAAPLFWFNRY